MPTTYELGDDGKDFRAAHHEAGHAVVYSLLGGEIGQASLMEDGEGNVETRHPGELAMRFGEAMRLRDFYRRRGIDHRIDIDRGCFYEYEEMPPEERENFVAYMIALHAGPIAEQRYTGCQPHGCDADEENIRGLSDAAFRSSDKKRQFLDAARHQSERMVEHHWPLIEAVAAALVQQRTLTGDQVEAIILKSKPNPIPMR